MLCVHKKIKRKGLFRKTAKIGLICLTSLNSGCSYIQKEIIESISRPHKTRTSYKDIDSPWNLPQSYSYCNHELRIQISGEEPFLSHTGDTLEFIRTKSSEDYEAICSGINKIIMHPGLDCLARFLPPGKAILVHPEAANLDKIEYAGVIAHEAAHSHQFRYQKIKPGPLAEKIAGEYEKSVLERLSR